MGSYPSSSVSSIRGSSLHSEEDTLGYRCVEIHHFTTLPSFKKTFEEICSRHADRLMEGSHRCQRLAFKGVSSVTLKVIDEMREGGLLPGMRIMYDADEEILVVKIMVGAAHELGGRMFARMFFNVVDQTHIALYSLLPTGAGRFGRNSARSKEGDESFTPATRDSEDDWPSVVVEVGVSESLSELRLDAHFWLTQSSGATRIVILLSINKAGQSRQISIERWESTGTPLQHLHSTAPTIPELVQTITLEESKPYTGDSLVIPAGKVFDVLPGGLSAGDFQITCGELTNFNNAYWAK